MAYLAIYSQLTIKVDTYNHIGDCGERENKNKVSFCSAYRLCVVKCAGRLGTTQNTNQQEALQQKHEYTAINAPTNVHSTTPKVTKPGHWARS